MTAQLYLQIQLLVCATYLVFAMARRLIAASGWKPGYPGLARAAIALAFLPLAVSFALHSLPGPRLPTFGDFARTRQVSGEEVSAPRDSLGVRPLRVAQPQGRRAAARATPGFLLRSARWLREAARTSWARFALLLWFFGFLAFGARLARNAWQLRLVLRRSLPIHQSGRVRVVVSEEIAVPFSLLTWSAAWVVIPAELLSRRRDFKIARRHELEHHRLGDTLWALFLEAFTWLSYPNPFAHFWKTEINELQELSCDERLIGRRRVSPHDYGSCLMRVAEAALGNRQVHAGTACMSAGTGNPNHPKSFLIRRIEMLSDHHDQRPNRASMRWLGAGLGTLAVLLTLGAAYAAEQAQREARVPRANPGLAPVDPTIQHIAEKALMEALLGEQARSGFAIVAEPNSGRVLAVANVDVSDPLPDHWALSMRIEPASLTKPLIAAEALERGVTTPEEPHDCEHSNYLYGGRVFHDWSKQGFAQLSTEDTIVNSSDICSIKIAEELGPTGLRATLEDFGVGPGGSAQSFPEASSGILPPFTAQSLPFIAIGMDFYATPLEVLQAYGAIANGGTLMEPLAADSTESGRPMRRILSMENSRKVREMLRQVVVRGTAKGNAASLLYSTAGKTASGWSSEELRLGGNNAKADFATFIGYAPASKPELEVYVGIRGPKTTEPGMGAQGARHAAPVFRRIIEEALQARGVAPDLK